MPQSQSDPLAAAVQNLLQGCAGARAGERLLMLEEGPALGHYGPGLGDVIAQGAKALDLVVERRQVGFSPHPQEPSQAMLLAMAGAQHILYLARIGDQMRFRALPYAERSVVSYALDLASFSSAFGTIPHGAMLAMKAAINAAMAAAQEIHIRCPLGTDLRGRIAPGQSAPPDVGIRRFPMAVFAPVPMAGFSGKVALARFVLGTGSVYYQPFLHKLDQVVTVQLSGNRALRYDGPADVVQSLLRHIERVASAQGLDGHFVHSWHAGIHPGCAYPGRAEDHPERWTCSAFGNPRLLHFHSCGDDAPGEICWNLLDPTVTLDGVALWEEGRLHPRRIVAGAAVLDACPELAACFAAPARAVGL
ncbi:hypothetical protein Q9295_06695 [Xinfangfangia sp. CPCC 101601]|uniref:Leucyl aminopeptidase n=1 Tax=Pseudogemmobacter lacusdianii TaxID=3069608 RepID=A0ABU0VWC3_9RHOB|nr:hypothetical protein [Xinfangfangia sp. CPCC 101601]MDQ2066052.1 hypothetical protein [Xinfangfangia sp. CPCC 101601]